MNKELIPHVFASLQSLERYLENVKKLVAAQSDVSAQIQRAVPEQERVLKQMRRIANKLQLELAKEEWDSVVRSLRIFYGLNHMVRPDLIATLVSLSRGEQLIETTGEEAAASNPPAHLH